MRSQAHAVARAALAVAVLYGLLLANLLGAMAPPGVPTILCSHEASGNHPAGPPAHDDGCCMAGCPAGGLLSPRPVAVALLPPAGRPAAWSAVPERGLRFGPRLAAYARGPPPA